MWEDGSGPGLRSSKGILSVSIRCTARGSRSEVLEEESVGAGREQARLGARPSSPEITRRACRACAAHGGAMAEAKTSASLVGFRVPLDRPSALERDRLSVVVVGRVTWTPDPPDILAPWPPGLPEPRPLDDTLSQLGGCLFTRAGGETLPGAFARSAAMTWIITVRPQSFV